MTSRLPLRSSAAIFIVAATVTSLFVINLCDWIYGCNCHSWWAGAAEQCNINSHGGKHCPWCSAGAAGFAAVYVGIVLPQALLSLWPPAWPWYRRFVSALAAFPVIGATIGLVMGWWTGYWD